MKLSAEQFDWIAQRIFDDATRWFHAPICANIHPVNYVSYSGAQGRALMARAREVDMPIWSLDRWHNFWRARNSWKMDKLAWNGSHLIFSLKGSSCEALWLVLNLAVQIYMGDEDGRFPSDTSANDWNYLNVLTNRYLPKELYCSLAKSQADTQLPGNVGYRYGVNNQIQQFYPTLNWNHGKLAPGRVVMIAENYFYYFNSSGNFNNTMFGQGGGGWVRKQVHSGGLYFVFADSHSELVRPPSGGDWWSEPYPLDGYNFPDQGKGFFYHGRPSPAWGDD